MAIITDAEFLAMSLASDALNGESTTVRDAARSAASGRVLAAAKKRYALATSWTVSGVTIGDAPPELKDATAAIGAFIALAHRGVSDRDPTYTIVKDRHDAAVAFLITLADGEHAELSTVDMSKGGVVVRTSGRRRWGRDALTSYAYCPSTTGIDLGDGES